MRLDAYLRGMEEKAVEGVYRQLIELGNYLARLELGQLHVTHNIGLSSLEHKAYDISVNDSEVEMGLFGLGFDVELEP